MKKNYLKWALSSLLIIGSIGFATGKPDVAVKTPNLVIENQIGNSEIKDFRGEGDSFKGKLIHAGVTYDFEIDAYTGRAIKWSSNK